MIKDLIIALSLANLCMIRGWSYVSFTLSPANQYYMKYPSTANHFTAVMLIIMLLSAVFITAITIARRSQNSFLMKSARLAFLLALTIPANGILSNYDFSGKKYLLIILMALFLLAFLLAVKIYSKNPKKKLTDDIFIFLKNAVLIMSAFLVFNIFHTAWMMFRTNPASFNDKPPAAVQNADDMSHQRVLLLIFDEMSQDVVFENRPSGLELPEFDRFRSEALYADNAYPPGCETDLSLPSYITGRTVSEFKPVKPDEMMIKTEGEDQPVGWSSIPNLFSKVYEMGFNTSVIGWYHPYGRLFGDSLASCTWHPYEPYRQMDLSESLAVQAENLVDIIPYGRYLRLSNHIYASDLLIQKERHETYLKILEETKEALNNTDIDFIISHWPVPHPPGLYDRDINDFRYYGGSYLDNLALADRTLEELRHTMEASGTWDNTSIIITSDHWWRKDLWMTKLLWTEEDDIVSVNNGNIDHRVPFLLKLAGHNEDVRIDNPFNTVIIHNLVIELLNNKITDTDSAVSCIRNNSLNFAIPDYEKKTAE